MIKKEINKVLALVAGLLYSIIVPAQELPVLPADKAVKMEHFPNGMTCYVVANPHVKGFADYAIVRRSDMSEVLRWENCLVSDANSVDSTLLHMVRMVEVSGEPADHALFVCGDLDASSVLNKVRYMSFMVPSGNVPERVEFPSGELSEVVFREVPDTLSGRSVVLAEWTSPRTPAGLMNTVQKAIYDKTVYEFVHIVSERMKDRLSSGGICADDLFLNHRSSLDGPGEELFVLGIEVDTRHAGYVMDELKQELGSIDTYGAEAYELHLADDAYMAELSKMARYVSNRDYMDMCISAYLYNSHLAAPADLLAFHRSKDISDELRKSVFTSISSALLDIEPGEYPAPASRYITLADTLALPGQTTRATLRSIRKDPFSGGVIWTFFNGFKVVYKRMPTNGMTYYSLAVNGGYGSIAGHELDGKEHLSGYIDSCYISGMKADYFADMLQLAGVTLKAELNFSNVIISGEVQDDNIGLLMKSLLAVANERSLPDPLFDSVSSKMNDGVLVIVSDMEESALRKQVSFYVGDFRTKERALRHVNVNRRTWPDYYADSVYSDGDAIVAEISASLPLTMANCAAADIATLLFGNAVKDALSDLYTDIDVSHTLRIYPAERYTIRIAVAAGDGNADADDLLWDVRNVLSEFLDSDIEPAMLAAAKDFVKHRTAIEKEEPSYWLHSIAMRYLDGKDFTTGYETKVNEMTSAYVISLLALLNS